ncbi:Fe-S-containing protein [Pasteurellaceae bacterium LIM206]|nr:Fe-S-containing protein [Pasteurellaceae bacterium LIM206]
MTYFFTFLLQTLLPTSLLLGASWANYSVNAKSLIWLSLLALLCGSGLAHYLPTSQTATLILNCILLSCFVLFYLSRFIHAAALQKFWHWLLLSCAALLWAKDPNIAAITGTDVINTDFILHIGAICLGLIFCFFMANWLAILLRQSNQNGNKKTRKNSTALWLIVTVIVLVLIVPLIGQVILGLMKLQIIDLTKPRLSFVAKTGNITGYFNYIFAGLLVLIMLWFSLKIHLPRKRAVNASQELIEKRQKTATFRTSSRLIRWGLLCVLIIFGSQLYWDKVASQPPRLSEAVAVKLGADKNIHVPVAQVKDGKLHRFVWIADDGKAIRFFIINRLPDRLSLTAVFDACLLCGDTGYVMQDNQVVCVGCGVRLFTPSIGKPGGCNPVPINNWQQTETEVIISKESLNEGLNLFSTVVEIQVTDPVDGSKLTNTKAEFKYNYNDRTYFFASEKNLDLFRDNPEQYLQGEQ